MTHFVLKRPIFIIIIFHYAVSVTFEMSVHVIILIRTSHSINIFKTVTTCPLVIPIFNLENITKNEARYTVWSTNLYHHSFIILDMTRARFGGTHFVRWDNSRTGGRWFECAISDKYSDGKYNVKTHDGDSGFFPASQVSHLGIKSSVGDTVLAYRIRTSIFGAFPNRTYASNGKHSATDTDGKIWVYFDDGEKVLTESSAVHKLSTL